MAMETKNRKKQIPKLTFIFNFMQEGIAEVYMIKYNPSSSKKIHFQKVSEIQIDKKYKLDKSRKVKNGKENREQWTAGELAEEERA